MNAGQGHIPAAIPPDDAARVAALKSYGLLDTPPEEEFDQIARIAAALVGAPIALVSLVDTGRQWFKARYGLDVAETPREFAFCAHAILGDDVLVVPDARLDPRFMGNPLVTGEPHVRSYAGAPLVAPGGHRIGTVCVIDHEARDFSPEALDALRDLSQIVVRQLEARRRPNNGVDDETRALHAMLAGQPGAVFQSEMLGDDTVAYTYFSDGIEQLTGLDAARLIANPQRFFDLVHPDDLDGLFARFHATRRVGGQWFDEFRIRTQNGTRWIAGSARRAPDVDGRSVWNGQLLDITERMADRAALHARETQLAALNRTLPGVVFQLRTDREGARKLTYVSERLEELYGVSAQDAMDDYSLLRKMVDPADMAVIDADLDRARANGTDWISVHRVNGPRGQRWCRVHATPEATRDDALLWNGVLLDITDQRNAEDQVARERLQWRNLIDAIPDSVFIRDRAGYYLFANPAEATEHRLKPEDLVGKTFADLPFFHADGGKAAAIEDRSVFDTNRPLISRVRSVVKQDGRAVSFRITKVPFEFEGHQAILGIASDISEQIAAETARLEFENRFRMLAEVSPDVICRLDMRGRMIYVSPAVERVLGYTPEQALRLGLDIIHDDDRTDANVQFAAMSRGDARPRLTCRMKHANGTYAWIEILGRVTRGTQDGAPFEIVLVARDVSERKMHELELERGRAKLLDQASELRALAGRLEQSRDEAVAAQIAAEQANAAKTHFFANMSHELRTPLNAILGFSDFMLSGASGELSPRHLEYLQDIHASGEHLLAMVSDVLDLARIDAGRLDLKLAEVDARAIVADCLSMLGPRAAQKNLELTLEEGEAVALVADAIRLRQILINLIANAVKFTPDGGAVTVAVRDRPGVVEFTVVDTGCGMSPEEIRLALEPFRQVPSETRRHEEGSGLGLPIARSLTELHGGTLTIASEPDVGTTVTVVLPNSRNA